MNDPNRRPDPLVCPVCKNTYNAWRWDEDERDWEFDGEWWADPFDLLEGFVCSRLCYLKRMKEAECSPQNSKGCSCATPSTGCHTPTT